LEANPTSVTPPTLVDTAALCQRWKISLSTLHRLIRQGAIPSPSRLGRRLLRWRIEDIEQFERQLNAAGVAPVETKPEPKNYKLRQKV
jgi:predicted DNA-binding transcriptional regulator AlpA